MSTRSLSLSSCMEDQSSYPFFIITGTYCSKCNSSSSCPTRMCMLLAFMGSSSSSSSRFSGAVGLDMGHVARDSMAWRCWRLVTGGRGGSSRAPIRLAEFPSRLRCRYCWAACCWACFCDPISIEYWSLLPKGWGRLGWGRLGCLPNRCRAACCWYCSDCRWAGAPSCRWAGCWCARWGCVRLTPGVNPGRLPWNMGIAWAWGARGCWWCWWCWAGWCWWCPKACCCGDGWCWFAPGGEARLCFCSTPPKTPRPPAALPGPEGNLAAAGGDDG
mmetsp:Transcript_3556/g.6807  ORF Transcript_3556/g.6807 Transcript_3556/m.6807 type:complete len:273 (+) Transcript_3556:962-1780(+)